MFEFRPWLPNLEQLQALPYHPILLWAAGEGAPQFLFLLERKPIYLKPYYQYDTEALMRGFGLAMNFFLPLEANDLGRGAHAYPSAVNAQALKMHRVDRILVEYTTCITWNDGDLYRLLLGHGRSMATTVSQ
jgi:hypothetical protein